MPPQLHQQLPHRPITRNRIRNRSNSFEPKHSIFIAMHHSSLIRTFSARILHIIETFTISFPDIDFYAFYGLSVRVFYCAKDETGFAVGVVGDLRTVGCCFGFVGVEGSEDCAFG